MSNQIEGLTGMRARIDRLFGKYQQLVAKPLDFGTGEELFPSEVHLVEAIGEGRAETVTGLAADLGVTKGAVSQAVSKLQKRGYLLRGERAEASKEVRISLTKSGKKAFLGHARLHALMEASLAEVLKGEAPRDLAVFSRLLGMLESHLDDWISKLGRGQ